MRRMSERANTGPRDRAGQRETEILAAARTVFLRDGHRNTKLTAVAAEAGCSVGTLYTYFTDRDALLTAVLTEVEEEMRTAGRADPASRRGTPAEQISAANRAYLASYRENRDVMALMEEVAQTEERFGRQRLHRADGFIERNARMIGRLAADGTVPVADPEMTAVALSAAVSRMAYLTWVDGRFPDTDETFRRLCATADLLWLNTLGLSAPSAPSTPSAPEHPESDGHVF